MPKLRPTPEQLAIRRFNGFVQDGMTRHGITQTKLGEEIGLGQSDVSRRIKGEYRWTLQEMFRICELFGEDYAILEGGK